VRLFEAIIDANHRALAGDASAGLHPAEFAESLPLAALTCIDPRLNPLFPEVLGLPKEKFIWLRNAGNIITGPLSSTMRSLALACAVKGAKEIAVIGHNDCLVCKTSTSALTDAFRKLGVDRTALPDNLTEYFGLFASERQNVIKAADFVRHSPLIGPRVPVHGLMVEIETGRLEWVVNGYQTLETAAAPSVQSLSALAGQELGAFKSFAEFKIGEMKFPETKIGELATAGKDWLSHEIQSMEIKAPEPPKPPVAPPAPVPPKKLPLPPPIRPTINVRKWKK
jgi:carbonic anhydrase